MFLWQLISYTKTRGYFREKNRFLRRRCVWIYLVYSTLDDHIMFQNYRKYADSPETLLVNLSCKQYPWLSHNIQECLLGFSGWLGMKKCSTITGKTENTKFAKRIFYTSFTRLCNKRPDKPIFIWGKVGFERGIHCFSYFGSKTEIVGTHSNHAENPASTTFHVLSKNKGKKITISY